MDPPVNDDDNLQTHETQAIGCILIVGALGFLAGLITGFALAS
jgi:hypothetical protein